MGRIRDLADRYGVTRAAEFGVAGIIGFLAAEGIIVAGLFLAYGSVEVPSGSSTPALLAVDVVAFVVGVTVGFFVNEWTTVRNAPTRERSGRSGVFVRLAKYQGSSSWGTPSQSGRSSPCSQPSPFPRPSGWSWGRWSPIP